MTQDSFLPQGLSRRARTRLDALYHKAGEADVQRLLERVKEHCRKAHLLASTRPTINVALGEAIAQCFEKAAEQWERLPPYSHQWLCAAMLYFIENPDEENDFESLVGFDDDAEVLNACLVLARLDNLVLNIEDYA